MAKPMCPPHRFQPRSWRWLRRRDFRWVCVVCGYLTHLYDGIDRAMTRPVHAKMSVAFPGVNTVSRIEERQRLSGFDPRTGLYLKGGLRPRLGPPPAAGHPFPPSMPSTSGGREPLNKGMVVGHGKLPRVPPPKRPLPNRSDTGPRALP